MRILSAVVGSLFLAACFLIPTRCRGEETAYWPQWRGPNRDNVSTETGLLRVWPEDGPPLLWRVEGLGEGIASVSIAEGRVFTLGYRDEQEFVTAVSAETGEQLWMTPIGPAIGESRLMRWLGQRTPTVDEERVYTIRSNGDLICLDVENGRELWRRSYTEDFGAEMYGWGICDYPLVDGEKLICCPRGDEAIVVALNRKTGEEIWSQQAAKDRSSYVATVLSNGGGVRQYVTYVRGELWGLAAKDGRLLWYYDKVSAPFASSLTPIVRGNQVLAYNGYRSGRALLNLLPDGEGVRVQEVYFHKEYLDPFQDSTVWVGDDVHTFMQWGTLQRYDARTGEPTSANEQRSRRGRNRIASLTYVDGHLIVRSDEGVVSLVESTTEGYRTESQFTVPDHEPVMGATNPVVTGGRLWLRDDDRLFCYDLRIDADSRESPQRITLRPADLPSAPERPSRPPRSVYVPTPADVVDRMLELARINEGDLVCDLGSGDGRIVIAAAKKYGCRAVGYEIDHDLVTRSRAAVTRSSLDTLVRIEQRDIATVDLGEFDVVAVYLVPKQLEALIPQLKGLKPGARIVSHQFQIPGIAPDRTVSVTSNKDGHEHSIHLWTAPLPGSNPTQQTR